MKAEGNYLRETYNNSADCHTRQTAETFTSNLMTLLSDFLAQPCLSKLS
jgi:hypothetical protein